MIKPGTLCVIMKAHPSCAHLVGQQCTFIRYAPSASTIDDCQIDVPSMRWVQVYAPAAWLLPIQGDPDQILQFECEREHV